jgi:hypothetical protein
LVWAFGGFREIKSGATTSPPLPLEKADCEQDGEHQPHSLGRFFDMSKNKTPAEKLHDIYFALGVAIAQWQQVEMALTQLFVLLINSDGGAASAAFNRVHSPMNRLEMVMASASVRLKDNPTLFNECTTICKRLKNEVKKRNQLAHFSLYQRPPESIENAEDVDWYLRPTAFDGAIEWRYKHGVPELTTNEIKDCIASFQKAAKELWDFSEKVRAALSEKT